MKKLLILISLLTLSHVGIGQNVKIGIWRDHERTEKFYFMCDEKTVWDVGTQAIIIPADKAIYFTLSKGLVRMSSSKKVYGRFKSITAEVNTNYTLISLIPIRTQEIYSDQISISVADNSLKVINSFADIDNYISGVVEAETGKEQNKEFYKAQATISRTFALSNSRRHEAEGFNLCDQVHCQVYHGISRHNPDIILATRETEGEVIVDPEINLITASFHSNCGGITTNSEDVWSKPLPYLRSVVDTFCTSGAHYQWDKSINTKKWLNHISNQYTLHLDPKDKNTLLEFESPQRERFLEYHNTKIERKELRRKWHLKSTFFNSTVDGNQIILSGHGYGHGVGMCQEGAMRMSQIGYTYNEILQFYYTDVHLIHLSVVAFFKE